MKRRYSLVLIALVLAVLFAATALAQQQGGGQMSAMREKYKYTFQLQTMVRHIGELEKDKKHALSPAQAKQVLAVLKPLRSKPKMTQDQAKDVAKRLKKVFTVDQLNAMARIKSPFRSGGPGGGPGRTPGQGGGPGARPGGQPGGRRFDPNAMKDFNPFYATPPKGDERAAQRAKRWNEFFVALEKKAKGK